MASHGSARATSLVRPHTLIDEMSHDKSLLSRGVFLPPGSAPRACEETGSAAGVWKAISQILPVHINCKRILSDCVWLKSTPLCGSYFRRCRGKKINKALSFPSTVALFLAVRSRWSDVLISDRQGVCVLWLWFIPLSRPFSRNTLHPSALAESSYGRYKVKVQMQAKPLLVGCFLQGSPSLCFYWTLSSASSSLIFQAINFSLSLTLL